MTQTIDLHNAHPSALVDRLREAGLRPTRQRLALARLLYGKHDRHISAEQLYTEAQTAGLELSLATVYNTLNQFTEAGLLHEINVEPGRSLFDTNTVPHHHFYMEMSGQLIDFPDSGITISGLPAPPDGTTVQRVDIVVRIQKNQ